MLDTSICVDLIRSRSVSLVRRLTSLKVGDVGISCITLAELAFGVEKSREPEKNRKALAQFITSLIVAPFDQNAAMLYGAIRQSLERAGQTIGALDALIAAHALSLGLTLVSHNTREFQRIAALRIEDWEM
jgi:tRNA(fMet)-specific endonuclease VapC